MTLQAQLLFNLLQVRGALSSPQIQAALNISQPTASRLLGDLARVGTNPV
jgi:predicted transcriptional regulator